MQLVSPTKLYYPLLTRAWVYQERILSTQVVQFGHYEVFSECRSCVRCECDGIGYHGSSSADPTVQMKVEHSQALELVDEGFNEETDESDMSHRRAQLWHTMVTTYCPVLVLGERRQFRPVLG